MSMSALWRGTAAWLLALTLSLAAAPTRAVDCDNDEDVEGTITALNPASRTVTISGFTVGTDSETKFEDAFSNPIAFEDFIVGEPAEARYCPGSGTPPIAIRVQKELAGTGTPTSTATPTPTSTSTSTATATSTSTATATISPTPSPDGTPGSNNCGQESEGILTEIDTVGRTMVIAGVHVVTDSRTRYEDRDDNVLAFESFLLGDKAEAEGCFQPNGALLARKIELKERTGFTPTPTPGPTATPDPSATPSPTSTPGGNDCDHEVESFIASIDADARTMMIGMVLVRTDGRTRYEDRDDNVLSFESFQAGDKAEAEGCFQPDGTLLAKKIELKFRAGATPTPSPTPDPSGTPVPTGTPDDPNSEDIHVLGLIDSVSLVNSTISVAGLTFLVTDQTRIETRRDELLTLADLAKGMRVDVEARPNSEGVFVASEIKVLEENIVPGGNSSQKVLGTIAKLELPNFMAIGNVTIDLSAGPLVRNFDDLVVSLDNLFIGDYAKVEGFPQTDGTLLAAEIEVRGSVLAFLDLDNGRLTASNTTILVSSATEVKELEGTPLALTGLVIGDLLKIEGTFNTEQTELTAREIRRIKSVNFSGEIPGFTKPAPAVRHGVASIQASNNSDTFGFVELPNRTFPSLSNTLFEVRGLIGTEESDRSAVPTARLRTNMSTFEKGSTLVLTSTGDGRFSPTLEGKEYRHYFVPALPPAGDFAPRTWFSTLDLINVDPSDASEGLLRLDGISATPIDFSRVRVAETLVDQGFSSANHGWRFGSATDSGYTRPTEGYDAVRGALTLASSDNFAFGFWDVNTGVRAQPNTLYRGRFQVSSGASSADSVPTFRLRLNTSSFQAGATTNIESTGGSAESPLGTPRLYDVYLFIPGTPVDGDEMLAAFDLTNFTEGDATGAPVRLEHFTLERLEILP